MGSREDPPRDTALSEAPESGSSYPMPEAEDDLSHGGSPASGSSLPQPANFPVTGDSSIDAVVAELAASTDGSLDGQVEAAARLERVLNDRLGDLDSG